MLGEYHGLTGGSEEWEAKLAEYLSKYGVKVDTLYVYTPVKKNMFTTYITRFSLAFKLFFYSLNRIKNYDYIQVSKIFIPLLYSLLYNREKLIVVVHNVYGLKSSIRIKGLFLGVFRGLTEIFTYKFSSPKAYLVPIFSVKKKLIKLGINSNKIFVTGSGVDTSYIDSIKVNKSKNPEIVFLGRLVKSKNPSISIKLAAELGIKLHIIGDGPLRIRLENYSKMLNANVIFHGYLKGYKKYLILKRAWLMIHPSVEEGLPLSVLEAMASGTPVIAYRIDPLTEIIQDGVNGFLVSNYIELKNKVSKLLNNKQLLNFMSKECRRTIVENYKWDKVANRVFLVYKSFISK